MELNHLSLLFLILLYACSPSSDALKVQDRPNILFIFTDDQTYTAVHALGNEVIQTPNMDRLVNAGTTFTHAFNMGAWNGAVCLASRAMINSGRFLWRVDTFKQRWVDGDSIALDQTWSRIMQNHGYDTYMTGKWHVDAPADQVFQRAAHIRPGMPGDAWNQMKTVTHTEADGTTTVEYLMPVGYNRPKDENDHSWSPSDTTFGGFWEGGKHWSEVVKDDAVAFIRDAQNRDNPFFMYLAFNAPHDPRQAPEEFLDLYPVENIPLPESWLPEYPYQHDIGLGPSLRDEALAPFPRTPYTVKTHLREYYAIITHLDRQIGLILDELEATGQLENTYIFFTADHGLAVGRHGLLGKQNLYDHSIRVPLVMAGKDIPRGKSVDAEVYLQDIMATSLEVAGIAKPGYVEFNSFLNLAKGNRSASHYPGIYGAYIDLQRMIRKDGFKLIVYPKIGKVLLFDLENDPEEMTDLAGQPEYRDKAEALFEELLALQKSMDDELDLQPVYHQFTGREN